MKSKSRFNLFFILLTYILLIFPISLGLTMIIDLFILGGNQVDNIKTVEKYKVRTENNKDLKIKYFKVGQVKFFDKGISKNLYREIRKGDFLQIKETKIFKSWQEITILRNGEKIYTEKPTLRYLMIMQSTFMFSSLLFIKRDKLDKGPYGKPGIISITYMSIMISILMWYSYFSGHSFV